MAHMVPLVAGYGFSLGFLALGDPLPMNILGFGLTTMFLVDYYNTENEKPGALRLRNRLYHCVVRTRRYIRARLFWLLGPSTEEQHNLTESPIHRLPNELALIVVQQISGADALSFRVSCRRFFYLNYPDPYAVTREDSAAFARLCQRDRFIRFCQADREGTLVAHACSYCRTTHPRRHFSAEQLLCEPDQRRCIGATTPVPLCPHLAFRHDQLAELRNKPARCCEMCNATASIWGGTWTKLERTYFRLEVARGMPLDQATLVAAIVALAPSEQICRHLSTESVAYRFPKCWLNPSKTTGCCSDAEACKEYCNGSVVCMACTYGTRARLVRETSSSKRDVDIVSFQSERDARFATKSGAVAMSWLKLCDAKFTRE